MPFQPRRTPIFASSTAPRTVILVSVDVILPRVESMVHSISPMPYTPMASTRKLMPCRKPEMSRKISRGSPLIPSKPTVASTSPRQIDRIVFGMSSLPSPTNVANASSISAKISGGPKLSATEASTGANAVNSTLATVPPTKEAMAAVTSASRALPCRASGRPSKVVATAVEAPGMPSVMDEMAPPYMAP